MWEAPEIYGRAAVGTGVPSGIYRVGVYPTVHLSNHSSNRGQGQLWDHLANLLTERLQREITPILVVYRFLQNRRLHSVQEQPMRLRPDCPGWVDAQRTPPVETWGFFRRLCFSMSLHPDHQPCSAALPSAHLGGDGLPGSALEIEGELGAAPWPLLGAEFPCPLAMPRGWPKAVSLACHFPGQSTCAFSARDTAHILIPLFSAKGFEKNEGCQRIGEITVSVMVTRGGGLGSRGLHSSIRRFSHFIPELLLTPLTLDYAPLSPLVQQ